MKKLLFSIILTINILNIYAQSLTFNYHFEKPAIRQIDSYQILHYTDSKQYAKVGNPSLPYIAVKLLLPPGTEATKIEINYKSPVQLDGKYNLYPMQEVKPLNQPASKQLQINRATYKTKLYPQNKAEVVSTQYMNGFGFALSQFSPIEYNPSEQTVTYYRDVEVKVFYNSTTKSNAALKNISNRASVLQKVKNFADNPLEISKYPQKSFDFDDYEMLIITTDEYVNSFDTIIQSHLLRGIRSKIVSLSTISSSMTGVDLQEKMRNYIIQEYQNHNIEFVMLGGDADVVPYRALYCEALSGGTTYSDNLPADVYFSALDGTWNDDGDDRWGEPDEDDLLPDIAVGRLPFSNATELANISNKIVSYSDNPVTSTGELNNPLLAGEDLYNNPQTWGADYLDLLIGYHTDNGYTTDGIPDTSIYTTMYARDGSWDGSGTAIMAEMNSGHSFVHHVGHANSGYMMGLYTSDITSSNFANLDGTTHNYALVYSHGCICGAFDDDDCISETMVKIDKCAVGVFTNSRYGWFNEGQTEGPSTHLHREFVNALYHDKINFAGIDELLSKYRTAPWVENPDEYEPGAQRWVFYDHNVLTDPALPIWTSNPFNANVQYATETPLGADYDVTVTFNGNPLENYTCVLIQNDKIIAKAFTDATGQAILNPDLNNSDIGDATLVVSGYDILPQQYNIQITPATDAVLNLKTFSFSDANNNEPDYNEALYLDLEIKNIGQQNATNVNATVTCSDSNITILNGTYNIGSITALDSVSIENELQFKTGKVPDQYSTTMTLTVTSDQYNFTRTIPVIINAPKIEISDISLVEATGNGDGYIQAGETANLSITYINNGHCTSQGGNMTIFSETSNVSFSLENENVNPLATSQTYTFESSVTIASELPDNSQVSINCNLNIPDYGLTNIIQFVTGKPTEDFETGDLLKYDWETTGDAPWNVESTVVYDGTYSAVCGDIDDNQISTLQLNIDVLDNGTISFYKKVSTEENYDYLRFYIDGVEKGNWSGDIDWSYEEYAISAGTHTVKWEYAKDYSVSEGSDLAYIDNITFPMLGKIVEGATSIVEETKQINTLLVYPQPSETIVNFRTNFERPTDYILEIYNVSGQKITTKTGKTDKANEIRLNIENLNSGLYLYRLKTSKGIYSGQLIKK